MNGFTPHIIGYFRNGQPMWAVSGGDGTGDPPADPPAPTDPPKDPPAPTDPPADPPKGDDDLDEIPVPDGADDEVKRVISKRNSELRALRARTKTAEEKARKYDQLEDAKKTESQRLTERATAAEKKAQEAELRALRLEVAADKGLKPAQAKRLVGTTKEELEADADELLETFGQANDDGKGKPPGGRPKERLRGGGDPTEEPEETDPRKLAAKVPRL